MKKYAIIAAVSFVVLVATFRVPAARKIATGA